MDWVLRAIGYDKKRSAGEAHTMVLPVGDVGAEVAEDVAEAEVRRAIEATR